MERIDREGQIATAATMARCISAIPMGQSGPSKLLIYDIHALQERFYFGDRITVLCDSASELFKERLAKEHDRHIMTITFLGKGAYKRFGGFWHDYEVVLCSKVRNGEKRSVNVLFGDCRGRHVVIVDDLVRSGTLLECVKKMFEMEQCE
jgi:phosphoribosylpyrophosphate synthetase